MPRAGLLSLVHIKQPQHVVVWFPKAKFPNLLHSLSDAHVADVMCVYAIAGATMASLLLVVAVLALAITSVYAVDPDPVKGAATC